MKRTWFALMAAILLVSASGCLHRQVCQPESPSADGQCRGLLGGLLGGGHACQGPAQQPEAGPPGPPTAAYAYPYYTLHGPRDFLLDNPPSIGR